MGKVYVYSLLPQVLEICTITVVDGGQIVSSIFYVNVGGFWV